MEPLMKLFGRISLGLIAGFGVYYVISTAGFLFNYILVVVTPEHLRMLVTTPVSASITVAAVALGAMFAGHISRERGSRKGLIIAAVPIVSHMVPFVQSQLSIISTLGQAEFPQEFRVDNLVYVAITLLSWALMLIAGWLGGRYGERQAKGESVEG